MKPPRAALPLLAAALAFGGLAFPAYAFSPGAPQGETGVAAALRAQPKPLALADLPATYRAVALGTGSESFLTLFGFGMSAGLSGGSSDKPADRLLLSALGATWVDPDEFEALLGGKTPRIRAYRLDLPAMMVASKGESGSTPAPRFAETWIEAGRIVQWSPLPGLDRASMERGLAAKPAEDADRLQNAESAAIAILMYTGDHDEIYPPAESTAAAKAAALPYLKDAKLWPNPGPDGRRLLFNTALSRKSLASIEAPAETLLLWDDRPGPDGKYAVAFADGHARLVDTGEWQLLQDAERRRRLKPAAPKVLPRPGGPVPATKTPAKIKPKTGGKRPG